jgi:hypothetical protein
VNDGKTGSDDVPIFCEKVSLGRKPGHSITLDGCDEPIRECHLAVLIGNLQLDELAGTIPATAGPFAALVVDDASERIVLLHDERKKGE